MLILYTGANCPFCRKVEAFLEDKGIEYTSKNVHQDDSALEELLELGGKRQIPFLHDTETGSAMYESQDIIDYVAQHYGQEPEDIIM